MLLTPRYTAPPVLSVEVRSPGAHPLVAQRQRLGELLADLSDAEWAHPSRCEGWTVQDVVTHLTSTNGFWVLSIQAGLAGEPTRFLGAFDPVATPAQLVDQVQGTAVAETLEAYAASTGTLVDVIDALDDEQWDVLAEAPPGHLPIRLVADHALWDCWVHERDIVLPLGRPPVVEAAEVLTCLRYGAGLGHSFQLCRGLSEEGAMAICVTDPASELVVAVGPEQVRVHGGRAPEGTGELRGDAVEVLERLSMRDVGTPSPAELAWFTAGLAEVFDQPAPV